MTRTYEYKVIPAPRRGEKTRGAKTVGERFGVALAHAMNDLAVEGWEYLRAEALPCDERSGLTGTATHFHHMLVFRRPLPAPKAEPGPAAQSAAFAAPAPAPAPVPEPAPDATAIAALKPHAPEGAAPALGPADEFRASPRR
jgi:hypothetical protein